MINKTNLDVKMLKQALLFYNYLTVINEFNLYTVCLP